MHLILQFSTEKELELKMRLKRDNGIRGVPKEKILADFSKRRFQYESNYYKWMDDCDIIIKNMENKFDVLKELYFARLFYTIMQPINTQLCNLKFVFNYFDFDNEFFNR